MAAPALQTRRKFLRTASLVGAGLAVTGVGAKIVLGSTPAAAQTTAAVTTPVPLTHLQQNAGKIWTFFKEELKLVRDTSTPSITAVDGIVTNNLIRNMSKLVTTVMDTNAIPAGFKLGEETMSDTKVLLLLYTASRKTPLGETLPDMTKDPAQFVLYAEALKNVEASSEARLNAINAKKFGRPPAPVGQIERPQPRPAG